MFCVLYVFIYTDRREERLLPARSNYLENDRTYILVVHYSYSICVNKDNPGTCIKTYSFIMGMSAISVEQSRAQDW